ncbi:fibrobacter succinogenes major paralogous domain-containing protein [candidate division KSB1 bacterium]
MKNKVSIPFFFFGLAVIILTIILFSCKKNSNEEDVPDSNAIEITTYEVSESGCNFVIIGSNIINNSNQQITQKGICWSLETLPDISDSLTNEGQGIGEFYSTLTNLIIDTLYYSRAYAITADGIKYGNEISFRTSSCTSVTYGGKIYNAVQIGNQCWMAENLNIGSFIHGSLNQQNNLNIEEYAYNNDTLNWVNHGGLYQWDELMSYSPGSSSNPSNVQGICPQGWHIPSDAEWKQLEMFLGMNSVDANSTGWRGIGVGLALSPTGSSGFNAQYGGYRLATGAFADGDCYGYYWTATNSGALDAYYRILKFHMYGGEIYRAVGGKVFGQAVRCVKN